MGNTNSMPVVSQVKSATQYICGDSEGARETQNQFVFNNTFPGISQISSLIYAIGGNSQKAKDLQAQFLYDLSNAVDTLPVAGHIKGGVHFALGDIESGEVAMKAASRTTGVMIAGAGGFFIGGPVGAVAAGIAGGAGMDGIITGSEYVVHGPIMYRPHGYVAAAMNINDARVGLTDINAGEAFDMALMPVFDGVTGYCAGRLLRNQLGRNAIGTGTDAVNAAGAGDTAAVSTNTNGNYLGLDKAGLDNRANQLNPNHVKSGPGRPAGYHGAGTYADLNNHANQMNPNNPAYAMSRGKAPGLTTATVNQPVANSIPSTTITSEVNSARPCIAIQRVAADENRLTPDPSIFMPSGL